MWEPELAYVAGEFRSGLFLSDKTGHFTEPTEPHHVVTKVNLNGRAMLPGLINAHSHAFQRVIRGRTEYRQSAKDSFWTWREMMYSAATRLSPDDLYDASRMAFLEMALSGITSVGEFHYIHRTAEGLPYDDPNLLAKQVVRAAREVGLRIALLRVAYARSGFETEPNPQQQRFIEPESNTYLKHLEMLDKDLQREYGDIETVWVGMAPHSVRAVPLPYLKDIIAVANAQRLPVHMHVAEQPAEVSACIKEHGRSPVALLSTEHLLSDRFTAVHAIHVTPKAVQMLADAKAMVCACPTTERNLGDGIVPVDAFFSENVSVSLGSDSHIQIDLLEDARELEYHLRLQKLERAVLDPGASETNAPLGLAARLFDCATISGARSINAPSGAIENGQAADFFTVDLNDPSIAGASPDDLLTAIVFSLSQSAVKDVVVGGKRIVEDGRHPQQEEIIERFKKLQKKLWG
jgi:formimidoylglutamate deiminase